MLVIMGIPSTVAQIKPNTIGDLMKRTMFKKIIAFLVVFATVFSMASCSLIARFTDWLDPKEGNKTGDDTCQHTFGDYTEFLKKGEAYVGVRTCSKCEAKCEDTLCVVSASDKWLYDENSHWNQLKYTETASAKDSKVAKLNTAAHTFDENGTCTGCHYNSAVSVGLDFALNSAGDGYVVVGRGTCRDEHINIPSTYEGLPVVGIGDNAFADILPEEKVEEGVEPLSADLYVEDGLLVLGVTIPETVISISCTAFADCAELANFIVDLANTVYTAVDNCLIDTVLKSIVRGCEFSVIPEDGQVTAIGSYAFAGSTGLVTITIPETVEEIGDKAFMECDALIEVYMPENINVGIDVFRGSIHVEIVVEHTLELVPAKEATCEEAGNVAYYVCTDCGYYYSDENGENRIYEVTIPAAHDFVNGECTKCGAVQDKWLIVSICEIAHLGKFPLGTLEDAIGLPLNAQVTTKDGNVHELPIIWDLSTYNKAEVGEYTITGVIQSGNFHFAEGLTNKISVGIETVENFVGTADIVFVLDISGSMGDEINNVKVNLKALAQAIEEAGVAARWSVITYSDFADVPGEPNEVTQVRQNGGNDWSSNADDCKAVIDSIELAWGGDGPEVAVDGLMMANSFDHRKDARVFYILLTDADYKVDNNYGVESMDEAVAKMLEKGANVSIITDSSNSSLYAPIAEATGGIVCNIYGNFGQQLTDTLVPIIYGEVVS